MIRLLEKMFTSFHIKVLQLSRGRVFGRAGKTRFLILHTVGRRSAKPRATPLNYVPDGDNFVVIASHGGAPTHPDWYHNLQANPDVVVEVAGRRIPVRAETVTGEERDRLWQAARASWRAYDGYQKRAARQIPVVSLRPTGG